MFLLQLKYETLRLLRSPALWLLVAFLSASVGFGIYNGVQRTAAKRQSISEMLATQQSDFQLQKMQADSIAQGQKKVDYWWKDPSNAVSVMWWGGRVVAMEPAPKSILASGISDLQPDAWKVSLMGKDAQSDSVFENPVNLASGSFDLAFVLAFLLPLLVIALSFNLISSEREQGTLALQRAQPVAFGALFFQKMLARFVLLAGLTLLVTMPLLAWLGIPLTSATACMTAGTAVLYSLFWFLLALGINLRGGSSALNALFCIGAWLGFTLVVPALVNMLAQKVHPVPSRAGFQTALREIKSKVEADREQILDGYYHQHPNAIRVSEDTLDWYDWKQCKNYYRDEFLIGSVEKKQTDSLELWYDEKAEHQADFADKLTLCSPTLSVQRQMTDLAGTSRSAFNASTAVLDSVQKNWTSFFLKKFDSGQSFTGADYEKLMKLPDRVSMASLPNAMAGMGWLLVQCLLVAAWAWWTGRHRIHF